MWSFIISWVVIGGGEVVGFEEEKTIIEIKNKLTVGDELEIIIPGTITPEKFTIQKLWDIETDEEIQTVNPGKSQQKVKIVLPIKVQKNWILRRKK